MKAITKLLQRLASWLRKPMGSDNDEMTSEYIPCGNGPKRSAGYLHMKDFR